MVVEASEVAVDEVAVDEAGVDEVAAVVAGNRCES